MASRKHDDSVRASDDLDRRSILKALLAVPAAACVTRTEDDGDGGAESKPKVLVVGAGIAGLAAARMLHDTGKFKVRVVDKADRIGGRIQTEYAGSGAFAGKAIELGPMFLHDIDNNPVVAKARELGFTVNPVAEGSRAIYTGSTSMKGELVDAAELARAEQDFAVVLARTNEGESGAMDSNLQAEFAEAKSDINDITPGTLSPTSENYYSLVIRDRIEESAYTSAQTLSWLQWDAGAPRQGTDGVLLQGFGAFLDALADALDIDLGEKAIVRDLTWSKENVEVVYDDDEYQNEHRETVAAVIYTAPYLDGRIEPALPEGKGLTSISEGSRVNRLYMHFPTPFWDTSKRFIDIKSNVSGAFFRFRDMSDIFGAPVLLTTTWGYDASSLDANTLFEASESAMDALRDVYDGVPIASDGLDKVKSDWSSFGGYVSRFATYDTVADYEARAKADSGRLFFAGDTTSTDHPNTVRGAYESGLRAAQQVIDALDEA